MHSQYFATIFLALVGIVFAGIACFAPLGNTGVDGSLGALLALIGTVATALGAGLLAFASLSPRWRTLLLVLSVTAAVLTAIAGYFLLQFALAGVMAAAALALVLGVFLNPRRSMA